jgi:hypothetical protein
MWTETAGRSIDRSSFFVFAGGGAGDSLVGELS